MTATLRRETFVTSRLLEYFTEAELTQQIGHARQLWPLALAKELIDNALDACETAGIAPEIRVTFEDGALIVEDNGPGLPSATIEASLDYANRVSTNSRYVSPTRGQLGNALKTVWAVPFVLDGEHGRVDVETPGRRHIVDVRLDRLAQEPTITCTAEPAARSAGTLVRIDWPGLRTTMAERWRSLYTLVAAYVSVNPHLTLTVAAGGAPIVWPAVAPGWKKWAPSQPTSPHWYTVEQLANLIAAYLLIERDGGAARTVREFIGEFRGLSSTVKQKTIAATAGLAGLRLADICDDEMLDTGAIERLLDAMRDESRAVEAKQLGAIGRENVTERLVRDLGALPGTVRYRAVELLTDPEEVPILLEVGFGLSTSDQPRRRVLTGVNWAPTLAAPFRGLDDILAEANIQPGDPVVLLVHVAMPVVSFTDRGKTALGVDLTDVLRDAVTVVTKGWTKAKRGQQKATASALRRAAPPKTPRLSIKQACYRVMEEAYRLASGDGRYPATARQVMYAARLRVMALTGGEFYEPDSQSFQQRVLPKFQVDNPELTKEWRVTYDDRGHLAEPHTGREVGLGTLAVDAYLEGWQDRPSIPTMLDAADVLSALEQGAGSRTSGPRCRYGALLFVEKEGFRELFATVRLAERYDLAIMSTKGVSVTACRNVVVAASERGIPVFVLHDFDRSGFVILRTLRENTARYTFNVPPNVIDFGIRIGDVTSLGLDALSEPVMYPTKLGDPGAAIREAGATDAEIAFLVSGRQSGQWVGRRVELNALTSEQLVTLIEQKLGDHGVAKVVPDEAVLRDLYIQEQRRTRLRERLDDVIHAAVASVNAETVDVPTDLAYRVTAMLSGSADPWESAIVRIAASPPRS